MGYLAAIDTGGTFTDGLFVSSGHREQVKVETTPHDLTLSLMNCLQEGAEALGYGNLTGFLREIEQLRYATTIGTNTVVQRVGAPVGLVVSSGAEVYLLAGVDRLCSNGFCARN